MSRSRDRRRRPITPAELRTLELVRDGLVVAYWHTEHDYRGLGLKPWFALSGGGVLPTQLHSLWLRELIRLDRSRPTPRIGDGDLCVGRARLTPHGRRCFHAVKRAEHERWRELLEPILVDRGVSAGPEAWQALEDALGS